jgi:hypothetical protein
MLTPNTRFRPVGASGQYGRSHGERRLAVASGALTTVAAATTTAGHVFSFRNPDTAKKVLLRYLAVDFNLTTAFGAAQAMGFDVIAATGYTASHTGGTAIDVGSTLANSQKIRTLDATSCLTANCVRIGTTGALTAGTHTLHANPLAATQKWMGAAGAQISATLLDARDDGDGAVRSAWEFGQDEGFIIRNTVLMGATGVGTLIVTAEWEEVSL